MEKYSAEQIQKKYDALPLKVKEVFEGMESADALQQIGKEHGLMLDKLGELADETGLVILGLTHPKDYINNLSDRLSVEKEEAKNIAEKVNQKVFQKIREELKKIHGIEEAAETALPPKTPEIIKPPAIKTEIKIEEKPKTIPPAAPASLPTKQIILPAVISKPEIAATPTPAALPKMPTPSINAPLAAPAGQPGSPAPKIKETPVPAVKPSVPAIPPPPSPVSPFEQKLHENEILRSTATTPAPEKPAPMPAIPRYTGKDPYREPTE